MITIFLPNFATKNYKLSKCENNVSLWPTNLIFNYDVYHKRAEKNSK